jgi:DNA-binding XRE family transcriptional regulator
VSLFLLWDDLLVRKMTRRRLDMAKKPPAPPPQPEVRRPKFRPLEAAGSVPTVVVQIGDRMRRARIEVGAQQTDMAAALEVSRQTIIDWETNKRKPSVPVMFAWAHITGVDYTWLRCGDCPSKGQCVGLDNDCPTPNDSPLFGRTKGECRTIVLVSSDHAEYATRTQVALAS